MKVLTPKSGINHPAPVNPEKSSTQQSPKLNNVFMNAILTANSGMQTESKTGDGKEPAVSGDESTQEQQAEQTINANVALPTVLLPNQMDLNKTVTQTQSELAANPDAKGDTKSVFKTNLTTKSSAKLNIPGMQSFADTDKLLEKVIKPQINAAHVSNTQHHIASSTASMNDLMPQSANKISDTSDAVNIQAPDIQNNKYTTALTQLGNFINSHTATHAANESARLDFNTTPAGYAEGLKKMTLPEYETKIELSPQNLDELTKDTYKASIKIYPPELGHVTAKLKISKDSAELIILTENSAVKEVVEANLTQLRENFQRADINLTNIQVQTQAPQSGSKEQNTQNQQDAPGFMSAENSNELNPQKLSPETPRTINSIIDTYA